MNLSQQKENKHTHKNDVIKSQGRRARKSSGGHHPPSPLLHLKPGPGVLPPEIFLVFNSVSGEF